MKLAVLAFFILAATLFLGEAALVLGYIALAVVAWVWIKPRWISACVTAICLAALVLHALGFKLYGHAIVESDRESLTNPRQATALESPSKVIFKDGSTIQLPDIFFPKSMNLLEGTTNYQGVFEDRFGIHARLGHDPYHQEWIDVEVQNSSTNISKAVCLQTANWCEDTLFQNFFPKRLPRRVRKDLGVVLVGAGLALPTVEHAAKAPPDWDPLMEALHQGCAMSLPFRHPEVIRLGRFLVDNRPDEFETGLSLLIEVEDTESYPKLAAEVRKRRANKPLTIEELGSSGAGLLPYWLLQLDPTEAVRLMKDCQMQSQPDCLVAIELAGILSQNGDWSGFDYLTALLARPGLDPAYRKSLGARLSSNFDFLREFNANVAMPVEISALFPQWYAENHDQLRWVRQPEGGAGFALNSGGVLDEAYYQTMQKYLEMARAKAGRL